MHLVWCSKYKSISSKFSVAGIIYTELPALDFGLERKARMDFFFWFWFDFAMFEAELDALVAAACTKPRIRFRGSDLSIKLSTHLSGTFLCTVIFTFLISTTVCERTVAILVSSDACAAIY